MKITTLSTAIFSTAVFAITLSAGCKSLNNIDLAEQLTKSYEYDGKQIDMEGELDINGMVWGNLDKRDTIRAALSLTSNLNNTKRETINDIILNYGKGKKNSLTINVPDSANRFTMRDVTVYDKNGSEISYEHVRVKGTVHYTHKGPKKESSGPIKIKPVKVNPDSENKDNNDYSYELINVEIEKAN